MTVALPRIAAVVPSGSASFPSVILSKIEGSDTGRRTITCLG